MWSKDENAQIEVWVERSDTRTRFEEHNMTLAEDGRPQEANCFLQIEEEAEFLINIRIHSSTGPYAFCYWRVRCVVDGRLIGCFSLREHRVPSKVSRMLFEEDGQIKSATLTFKRLVTTDNIDEVTMDEKDLKALGRIVVKFEPGDIGRYVPGRPVLVEKTEVGIAHEKTKKFGGGVGKGTVRAESNEYQQLRDFTSRSNGKILHQFAFTYRTGPVLELMGIIEPNEPLLARPLAQAVIKTKRDGSTVGMQTRSKRKTFEDDEDKIEVDIKPTKRIRQLEDEKQRFRGKIEQVSGPIPRRKDFEVIDLTADD